MNRAICSIHDRIMDLHSREADTTYIHACRSVLKISMSRKLYSWMFFSYVLGSKRSHITASFSYGTRSLQNSLSRPFIWDARWNPLDVLSVCYRVHLEARILLFTPNEIRFHASGHFSLTGGNASFRSDECHQGIKVSSLRELLHLSDIQALRSLTILGKFNMLSLFDP